MGAPLGAGHGVAHPRRSAPIVWLRRHAPADQPRPWRADVAARREQAAFDWEIGPVCTVAFAPDGMTAAAAGLARQVVVWDVGDI